MLPNYVSLCAKTVTGNQVLETHKSRGIDKNRVMHNPQTYILRCTEEGVCFVYMYIVLIPPKCRTNGCTLGTVWKLSMRQNEGSFVFQIIISPYTNYKRRRISRLGVFLLPWYHIIVSGFYHLVTHTQKNNFQKIEISS